jgi:hypothetical protein
MVGGACNQEVSDSAGSSINEQGESSLEESQSEIEDVEVLLPN